jgi:hypothetical protein
MIDGIFEFGSWYKMIVNVETTKVMIISLQQSPRSKTAGQCGVFQQFV